MWSLSDECNFMTGSDCQLSLTTTWSVAIRGDSISWRCAHEVETATSVVIMKRQTLRIV